MRFDLTLFSNPFYEPARLFSSTATASLVVGEGVSKESREAEDRISTRALLLLFGKRKGDNDKEVLYGAMSVAPYLELDDEDIVFPVLF